MARKLTDEEEKAYNQLVHNDHQAALADRDAARGALAELMARHAECHGRIEKSEQGCKDRDEQILTANNQVKFVMEELAKLEADKAELVKKVELLRAEANELRNERDVVVVQAQKNAARADAAEQRAANMEDHPVVVAARVKRIKANIEESYELLRKLTGEG